MSKKGLFIVSVFVWACTFGIYSQNNTNSPYSRYGYGKIVDAGFGQNTSMGGISYGLRANKFINPGNPASFTAIDTLTFRFEAGASLNFSSFEDATGKQSKMNGNLEYLALQFPIKNWLGFSAGLHPYSTVGYNFSSKEVKPSSITSGTLETKYMYQGIGGITRLYLGTAIIPLENLSLGATLDINFGTINHFSSVSFNDKAYVPTTQSKKISVSNLTTLLGAQYTLLLQKEQKITLGAVFQPKIAFGGDAEQTVITTDTIKITDNNYFDSPLAIGVGAVYSLSDKFLAGFDYKYQAWSDVRYFGDKPFNDRNKFSIGMEYQPNNNSKNYLKRVYYRIGANYSNSYPKVNGHELNEYGVSAGFGLPLKRGLNPTVVNTVFEYCDIGTKSNGLIKEQYFKFTLNMTINERWFMTRKFE